MQEKAWYKDNISLDSLAKRINVNKHQLSQVINQGKGISFTEYINKLRIDESIRLLNEHPDLSIKEVYFKVGYANKTSFMPISKDNRHDSHRIQSIASPSC